MIDQQELIEVVDDEGEITGIILDKDIVHDRNLLHNEVACFIINEKGETLLQKRSADKRFNPSKWAICAGHVDARERLIDAMQREILEEIGIKVDINNIIPLKGYEKNLKRKSKNSHISNMYFTKLNIIESGFTIQKEELSEVKWVNIDEVINIIKSDNNSTVFKKDSISIFEQLKVLI